MSRNRLDAIEARAAAATPGPWVADEDRVVLAATQGGKYAGWYQEAVATPATYPDAAFIAHARADIPALLAVARAAHDIARRFPAHRWDALREALAPLLEPEP